jgi:hypothetical protein
MGAMTSAAWIPPISSAESAERSGFSKTASESLADGAETWWEERELVPSPWAFDDGHLAPGIAAFPLNSVPASCQGLERKFT